MRNNTATLLLIVGMSIAVPLHAAKPIIETVSKNSVDIKNRSYSGVHAQIWGVERLVIEDVIVENNANISAYAPRIEIKNDFRVENGATFRAGVPVFKVHFVNMVKPSTALSPTDVISGSGIDFSTCIAQETFEEFCQNEIDILNYYFKSDDGYQLVRFEMKGAEDWQSAMENTNFYKCTSSTSGYDACPSSNYSHKTIDAFNDADFSKFRDKGTINIIFYNAFDSMISWANMNLDTQNGAPLVVIDYERVDENLDHECQYDSGAIIEHDCGRTPHNSGCGGWGDRSGVGPGHSNYGLDPYRYPGSWNNGIQDDDHQRRGVEPHEMGHVFGLHHACRQHPFDSADLWENIMTSNQLTSSRPYSGESCTLHCTGSTLCQCDYRTSFFERDPISKVDGSYKYIQSYKSDLDYVDNYTLYGQADIIMNMARHYKGYLE